MRIYRKIKCIGIVTVTMMLLVTTGCSQMGIGGNPELLKTQQTEEENNQEEEKKEKSYAFKSGAEKIKNDLLSSGLKLTQESIDDNMKNCFRLKENSGLFTVELFDNVSDKKDTGCQDIDIYYSEEMIKNHVADNEILLKKIFEDIGYGYKSLVIKKLENMFKKNQKNRDVDIKYNNNIKLEYSWENDGIKLRIAATDFKGEQDKIFGFDRSDVLNKLKKEKIVMSETSSKGDKEFTQRMLTLKNKISTVIVRDNKKKIDKNTGTEAVYIQTTSEQMKNNKAGSMQVSEIFWDILKMINSDVTENEINGYMLELNKLNDNKDNSKVINIKGASINLNNNYGNIEISIIPE